MKKSQQFKDANSSSLCDLSEYAEMRASYR